jgi:single-stranded-DNA-specific exonuclease
LTESHGQIVGSARSVKGFDIHQALERCADLLEQFGGHTHAAGLHLKPENLEAFIARFEELVQAGIPDGKIKADLPIDVSLPMESISLPFYDNLLTRLSPYGPGNMLPNFHSGQLYLTKAPFIMKEEHLKLMIGLQPNHTMFEAVGFGIRKDFYEGLLEAYEQQKPIELVYHIEVNEFRGQRNLQMRILDISQNKK